MFACLLMLAGQAEKFRSPAMQLKYPLSLSITLHANAAHITRTSSELAIKAWLKWILKRRHKLKCQLNQEHKKEVC